MKTSRALLVSLGTVVVLGLLLVGGDRLGAHMTERNLAKHIAESSSSTGSEMGTPAVSIGGFPFLTQLIHGSLNEVHTSIPSYTLETEAGPVTVTNIEAEAHKVTTSEPYLADSVSGTGVLSADSLTEIMEAQGIPLVAAVTDEGIVLHDKDSSGGLSLTVDVHLAQDGHGIEVRPSDASIAGVPISIDKVTTFFGMDPSLVIPVDALPEGLSLTGVKLSPSGVQFSLHGDRISLSSDLK